MPRHILIDRNTGYVWGETEAGSPTEAARTLDATNGHPDGTYLEHAPRAGLHACGTGGYLVYAAPDDFPEVLDGQDPAAIEAVSALRCLAFVERVDPVL